MANQDTCFIVSPIGSEGSDTRERSDKLLEYVIRKSVPDYGFNVVRADEIAEPGMITSQVIEHVTESELVIADLTGRNPNVFYELAIRHATQKPIIQIIDDTSDMPFDIADTRTITIDLEDIESIEQAKSEIGEQIETIKSDDRTMDTPVSVAFTLKELRESSDPDERSMAETMEVLTDVRTNIIDMKEQLNSPEEILPPDYLSYMMRRTNLANREEILTNLRFVEEELNDLKRQMKRSNIDENSSYVNDLNDRIYDIQEIISKIDPESAPKHKTIEEF